MPCENCRAQREVCNANQSCQCADVSREARGNHCCFDGKCVADGEFGVSCGCAREDEVCATKSCCPGYDCVSSLANPTCVCCGLEGSRCTNRDSCCDGPRCEDQRCVKATCSPPCTTGKMGCSGFCVTIGLDHCSGCGQGCPAYAADQCVNGQCTCGDGPPCDCLAGAMCVQGRCVCGMGPGVEGGSGQQVCSATLSGTSSRYNGGAVGPCPGGDAPLCTCTLARATYHGWCPVEA
jgi:hypothetical protein